MYVSHSTSSPYGRLGRYVSPYRFPLPANPENCALAGMMGCGGMGCAHCPMSGLGQSATAIRHRGMRNLSAYRPYSFPLPASNLQGLGALTTKTVMGAALVAAGAWFIYKSAKMT